MHYIYYHHHWFDLFPIGWDAISAIILVITAIFIWKQTKATNDLVENDTRPVVEASLIKEKTHGTYLQFLNKKPEIPALVWISVKVSIDGKPVDVALESKLKGREPWRIVHVRYKTSALPYFGDLLNEYGNKQIELSMRLYVAPLFLPERKTLFYEKFYRYEGLEWVDTHWGIPDVPFIEGK